MVERSRRVLWRVPVVVALILGTVVAVLWALQRQLIYFPDNTPVPSVSGIIPGGRDVTLHTADGLELGAWFVPAARSADTGMAGLVGPGHRGNRGARGQAAGKPAPS